MRGNYIPGMKSNFLIWLPGLLRRGIPLCWIFTKVHRCRNWSICSWLLLFLSFSLASSPRTHPQLRFQETDILLSLSVSASIIFPISDSFFAWVRSLALLYFRQSSCFRLPRHDGGFRVSQCWESCERRTFFRVAKIYVKVSFSAGPETTYYCRDRRGLWLNIIATVHSLNFAVPHSPLMIHR